MVDWRLVLRIMAWINVVLLSIISASLHFTDKVIITPTLFVMPTVLLLFFALDIHKVLLDHVYEDDEDEEKEKDEDL